ncbi:MAG: sirohydrochlorin nickelochelatase [Methanosphaera sp.]|nr:sirohydrochlorin nickelochelatase [Methanosphaera sp.]
MDTSSNSKDETGVLLIGHGSRLPYNKEVVYTLAEKFSARHPDTNVEVGFMELAEPNIPTAFNKLKETGVNKIVVTPVFLADGMHTKRDIPTILGLELEDISDITSGPAPESHEHEHHHEHDHGHHHHHHHDEEVETVEFDGEIIYTKPIGADDHIVDIIDERVQDNL